jgi:hypothetical protein
MTKTKREKKPGKLPPEILTFKADQSLVEALSRIPNRSEFIRGAILKAFESSCPFCHGTGTMTMNQRRHWDDFLVRHKLIECGECHETKIQCAGKRGAAAVCRSKRT